MMMPLATIPVLIKIRTAEQTGSVPRITSRPRGPEPLLVRFLYSLPVLR